MGNAVAFFSRDYFLLLAVIAFGRGMDFFSTWLATPNLLLEANPIARALRWRGNIVINAILIVVFARWPLVVVILTTTSMLVAARNFQSTWLMRSMGENAYRLWMAEHVRSASTTLYVGCVIAQCVLVAGVGGALLCFGG